MIERSARSGRDDRNCLHTGAASSVAADEHAARALEAMWARDHATVRRLSLWSLAWIVAGADDALRAPMRFVADDAGGVRFRCPQCRHVDHNGSTAVLDEIGNRWSCSRCKATGTRWYLERIVIEDPALLDIAQEVADAEAP